MARIRPGYRIIRALLTFCSVVPYRKASETLLAWTARPTLLAQVSAVVFGRVNVTIIVPLTIAVCLSTERAAETFHAVGEELRLARRTPLLVCRLPQNNCVRWHE